MSNIDKHNDALDRYKPPTEGTIDKAFGIGRDLVAPAADFLVPGISTAITTFTEIIKTPYEGRLQQWQEDIGTAVIELSKFRQDIVNELKTNDEFQSVLLQATQAAMRSHQQQKIAALRNAVVNTAKGIDISADLKQTFVRYVDELTPSHVALLRFLREGEQDMAKVDSYETLRQRFISDGGDIERDEFRLLCEDLQVRILMRVSATVNDFDDVEDSILISRESQVERPLVRVTEIAKQFLAFIN